MPVISLNPGFSEAGSRRFASPGDDLVLSGADTVLKTELANAEQAGKHFYLFGRPGSSPQPIARPSSRAINLFVLSAVANAPFC
jgi:hypothetical protein